MGGHSKNGLKQKWKIQVGLGTEMGKMRKEMRKEAHETPTMVGEGM